MRTGLSLKQFKEYQRKYYQEHKKQRNARAIKWAKKHPDQIKVIQKKYQKTHLEKLREKCRNYRKNRPELYNEYEKKKRLNHPEIEKKHKAKRRKLGFDPLNSWFIGSQAHHIDFECIIYIPKKLHQSISHNVWTGRGMKEINARALEYLSMVKPNETL